MHASQPRGGDLTLCGGERFSRPIKIVWRDLFAHHRSRADRHVGTARLFSRLLNRAHRDVDRVGQQRGRRRLNWAFAHVLRVARRAQRLSTFSIVAPQPED